uniref:Deoxynucleoside kinase domain-containing protein n=1 Tax=viral metagenome TaxID=1070528 RepID=A0A6C0JIR3_9ZZZZ
MSGPVIVISIEGNIGSGKSTILDKLEKYIGSEHWQGQVAFLREPVDIWERIKDKKTGENILEKFYGDQEKYAFPFQVMAYASRLSMISNAKTTGYKRVIVCERSLDADKHIFAKMLYDEGKIDDVCYQIYNYFYEHYASSFKLDGVVYIDADAEVCFDRIGKRARSGESDISLEYLQKCKSYHHEWLSGTKTPVLNINANVDVAYNKNDPRDIGNEWLARIKEFIDELLKESDDHEEWKRR